MELEEAINILETYNTWRRGAEIPQESPEKIGIAIDTVLDALKPKWTKFDGGIIPDDCEVRTFPHKGLMIRKKS